MAKNAVATRQTTDATNARPIDRFRAQVKAAMPTIMRMLPAHVTPEQFESRVVTAVANKPELLECNTSSLLRASAEAAELGISLNPHLGEGWILRVWNGRLNDGKGGYEAQLRLGFIGVMKLAKQSGDIVQIVSNLRYERDYWKMSMVPPDLKHEAADGDRGEVVGAYCWWKLRDGTTQFEYMPREEILAVKDRTKSRDKQGNIVGPWVTDEMEMWRKTPVRRARKYMPQSPEMARFHEAMVRDAAEEFGDEGMVHGDYVDVTEAKPPAPSEPAKKQTKSLEDRIAGPQRVEVPQELDGPDWAAWEKLMLGVAKAATVAERSAIFKLHEDLIEASPEAVDEKVRAALGHPA